MAGFLLSGFSMVLLAVLFVRREQWNWLNPHTCHTVWVLLLMIFIPVLRLLVPGGAEDTDGILKTNGMVLLYYLSFSLPFFLIRKAPRKGGVDRLSLRMPPAVLRAVLAVFLVLAVLIYVQMAHESGFGLKNWLLLPRSGRQFYRAGVGHWFVLSQFCIASAYMLLLFFNVRSLSATLFSMLTFCFFVYFFGAKGGVLYVIMGGILARNWFVKRQTGFILAGWFVLCAAVFALLFSVHYIQQKYYKNHRESFAPPRFIQVKDRDEKRDDETGSVSVLEIGGRMFKYPAYYNNTRMFFSDFDEHFTYAWGREYLSSLWKYVPRRIFSAKPFAYGKSEYISEKYYSGAAGRGHGPAFGGRAFRDGVKAYLNFGLAGLVGIGLLKGGLYAWIYRYFLSRRNFIGFALLAVVMGFIWFLNAILLEFLWVFALVFFLRAGIKTTARFFPQLESRLCENQFDNSDLQ